MKNVKIPNQTDLNKVNAANSYGVLKVRTFNQSIADAKCQAVPNRLFGEFIYEKEITFLYSDTNTGKSVLATQIGESIASGKSIHVDFPIECPPQKVLMLDFEMTDKQVEKRYSREWQDHYQFDDNFLRATIDYSYELPDNTTLSQSILAQVGNVVQGTEAKVIIIDNLTYLNEDNEKARMAILLMRYLKKLKSKLGLTLIVIAHTPKIGYGQPISINHLAGSKQLANFIDSAFAVGRCANEVNLRYLKQVKTRSELTYHKSNVPLFELQKIHNDNFLAYNFLESYESEYALLSEATEQETTDRDDLILEYHSQGKSCSWIAKEVRASKSTVWRIVQKAKKE
jgi:archaellum biogenesis ATPase FlaH